MQREQLKKKRIGKTQKRKINKHNKMLSRITGCRMLRSCPRNEAFASLEEKDMTYFRSLLPEPSVLTESLDSYNKDWWGTFQGNSSLVLKPKTTEQVSDILKYCN